MWINFNKYLKLKIQGKLAIAFAGLSIFPVLLIGYLGISANVASLRQRAIENLNNDLLARKERVASFFQIVEDNVQSLVGSSAFQHFLGTVNAPEGDLLRLAVRDLYPEVQRLARRKGFFYQITFVNPAGDEIFSLVQNDSSYHFLTQEELNRAGTRFYLYLAHESPANKATFVPVELQRYNRRDLLPAISCIYPLANGELSGLLIFNVSAANFFEILESRSPYIPAGKIILVNAEGYYLYHSEKKKKWDQLLAARATENLNVDYSPETANVLLSQDAEPIHEINGELIAHARIFTDRRELENTYSLLISVAKSEIYAPVTAFRKIFWGILAFILLASLFLAYIATQQLTRPLKNLQQEAEKIASGDYHSRVSIETYDEIQELAHQFNVMAGALEQHDIEISQHRERLEQMVRVRTKELNNEKNKLQAILDHVPSGFILLDRQYKIMTASATVKTISGKSEQNVLGMPCYDVIGNGEICASCPTRQVMQTGKMQSRLLQRLGTDGEECYYEHTAVPLKKGRAVEYVLEIITDVTERKRMQDQLIRSERLATTGEIAAYIAHEMRNSLTSIRMLLQLLSETEYLQASERESVAVALNSFERIEQVVNDLLQLARPAALDRKTGDINTILEESIDLSRHHVSKKGIEVVHDLAPELPALRLDSHYIKEAFINLILNATQAIDGKGKITFCTAQKKLPQKLRDLGEIHTRTPGDEAIGVREIVLKKGAQVVSVQISDSGGGIAEAHQQRIFDPFFTTKVNGTGLGLSFVKRVVNEHGGIVSVKSEPGKGSTFTLTFPVE